MNTEERIQHFKDWIDYYDKQYAKTKDTKYLNKLVELNKELFALECKGMDKLIGPVVTTTEHLKKFNEVLRKIGPGLLKDYNSNLEEQIKDHCKKIPKSEDGKPVETKFKVAGAEISIISTPYLKDDEMFLLPGRR